MPEAMPGEIVEESEAQEPTPEDRFRQRSGDIRREINFIARYFGYNFNQDLAQVLDARENGGKIVTQYTGSEPTGWQELNREVLLAEFDAALTKFNTEMSAIRKEVEAAFDDLG